MLNNLDGAQLDVAFVRDYGVDSGVGSTTESTGSGITSFAAAESSRNFDSRHSPSLNGAMSRARATATAKTLQPFGERCTPSALRTLFSLEIVSQSRTETFSDSPAITFITAFTSR